MTIKQNLIAAARVASVTAFLCAMSIGMAAAYDGIVKKQAFEMPSYTTVGGKTIKKVRIGYETYGTLNAAKDNVIMIYHPHTATSHAAGKYKPEDKAPGYWDSIIGAGKAIDTDRFFVISSDILSNVNTKDPNVITTGPASINPNTGKPYAMSFPIVAMHDIVNVQKALLESLGIKKLYAAMGASYGSAQALEWAAGYPDMVERLIAVVPTPGFSAFTIAMESAWTAPIMLDPNWKGGNYYGGPEPVAGMTAALNLLWMICVTPDFLENQGGNKWADPNKNPLDSWDNQFAIDTTISKISAGRAKLYDANSFIYLVRGAQSWKIGGKLTIEEGLAQIKAKVLVLVSKEDYILPTKLALKMADTLKAQGKKVEVEMLDESAKAGHLDCIFSIHKSGETIKRFLAN